MASNMPKEIEARIRKLPGNGVCADCSNVNPQWATVTYGALVCLECSGHHRALGVHLSFVRSVAMDSWTERQIAAMERSGGNAKLVEYLSSRGIDKSMQISQKYNTKQAAYYKERLTRWLDGKTEPPPDPGRYDPVTGVSEAQGAEPLPGETTDQYNARQARLRDAARERLRAKFGDGGIGGSCQGIGSDPNPGQDGPGLGGLVGGVLGGVGSFVKNNVIDNEKVRGVVGQVGAVAGDSVNSFRRSVAEGSVIDDLKSNARLEEDSVVRKLSGAVGGILGGIAGGQRATGGSVGGGSGFGQKPPDEDDDAFFAALERKMSGGQRNSNAGDDTRRSSAASSNGPARKSATNAFNDDWGEGMAKAAPPPVPTRDDMGRLAKDLGMKMNAPEPSRATGGYPVEKKTAAPVAKVPASPAPATPVPKKASLQESDDFFAEFGM